MKGLLLDLQQKDYLYLGYPMHLTPTELRIMQRMVEGEGSIVRAEALLAHCFDGNATAANLSVRICAINQKAQAIGGRRLICAHRGRGYGFCDDV